MIEHEGGLIKDEHLQPHDAPEYRARQMTAQRLGQLASYIARLAEVTRDPLQPLPVDEIESAATGADDITRVARLVQSGDTDAALAALALTPQYVTWRERLAPDEFPDIPFYRGIIAGELMPPVEHNDNELVPLHIISHRHIEIGGNVYELTGELLYMFNAFVSHRDTYVGIRTMLAHGFRESASPGVTRSRFHIALRSFQAMLQPGLPEDVEPILQQGVGKSHVRRLNPVIDVRDVRDDPAFTSLMPDRDTRPPQDREVAERPGKTLTEISKMITVLGRPLHRGTVQKRMTKEDWEETIELAGGVTVFPPHVAERIIARFPERHVSLIEMPPGFVRLQAILSQLSYSLTSGRAVAVLQAAGYHPAQLHIDAHYVLRGGVWCVEEDGAVQVLEAARQRESPLVGPRARAVEQPDEEVVLPPEPVEPPKAEPPDKPREETFELKERNTAEEIIAYIKAVHSQTFSVKEIEDAAASEPLIRPVYEPGMPTLYSYYAVKKILKLLIAA